MTRYGIHEANIRTGSGGRPLAVALVCFALAAAAPPSPAGELPAAIRTVDGAALPQPPAVARDAVEDDGNAAPTLQSAVIMEDLEAIRTLYEQGADLEAPVQPSGAHPLHIAAAIGMPPVVNLLVDLGADLEARDTLGRTPLIQAAIAGNSAVVAVLLAAGAEADAAETHHGTTALHLAAFRDQRDIIDLLLDYGAGVDTVDSNGETPLFWAIGRGHAEAITQLVNAGADINHRNHAGVSPLGIAAYARDRDSILRLLKLLGAEE